MTAIDWYFDKIKSHFEHDGDLLETATFTYAIAKQKEKQQIIDAFDEGQEYEYQYHINNAPKFYSETYFVETYGSKGSDELSKVEENTSFDTSSQTEISDEEIEEEADKYSDAYDCPSKIKLCKHDIKAAFINSIKWYREQLKKKQ